MAQQQRSEAPAADRTSVETSARNPRKPFVSPTVQDLGGLTLITLVSAGGSG